MGCKCRSSNFLWEDVLLKHETARRRQEVMLDFCATVLTPDPVFLRENIFFQQRWRYPHIIITQSIAVNDESTLVERQDQYLSFPHLIQAQVFLFTTPPKHFLHWTRSP